MRKNFNGQSRHVIDATVGLRLAVIIVSTAGSLLRSRNTRNLPNLRNFLPTEAAGGLSRSQRDTWKCRDTVDFILSFIRLDINCGLGQSDCGDIIDLQKKRKKIDILKSCVEVVTVGKKDRFYSDCGK